MSAKESFGLLKGQTKFGVILFLLARRFFSDLMLGWSKLSFTRIQASGGSDD